MVMLDRRFKGLGTVVVSYSGATVGHVFRSGKCVLSACLRVLRIAQKIKHASRQQRGRWALLWERPPLSPFLFGLLSTAKRNKKLLLAASPFISSPTVSAPVCENCSALFNLERFRSAVLKVDALYLRVRHGLRIVLPHPSV